MRAATARKWDNDAGPAEDRYWHAPQRQEWRHALRLMMPTTREELHQLPLTYIANPMLDGPVLLFELFPGDDPERVRDARGLQERLHCAEAGKFMGLCDAWKQSHLPEDRQRLALRIRRAWVSLVDLAIGYTWPGLDLGGAPCVISFDAS